MSRTHGRNLAARLSALATGVAVVLALASGCGAEPAPDKDSEGGAAGMSGAGGRASPDVGGMLEDLGGGGLSSGSGNGDGGALSTGGQGDPDGGPPSLGGSGGEVAAAGSGGEVAAAGSGGEVAAAGSGGEAGTAGSAGEAGMCVEPLPNNHPYAPYGTVLPSLNATCSSKGALYTAHYFELTAPTWVRFGLHRTVTPDRNEYAVLSSGCTGEGPIIADLLYCHSNAMELPAGSYSWGGCGLDNNPYNRYIAFGETSPAPTNIDCASAAQLPAGTGGPVFDSTPRYYAFYYYHNDYPEIQAQPGVLTPGGTLHAEVLDGCGVDAVTYKTYDFRLCHEDYFDLSGLEDDRVYYLKVSGWDPGAQWDLTPSL